MEELQVLPPPKRLKVESKVDIPKANVVAPVEKHHDSQSKQLLPINSNNVKQGNGSTDLRYR